MKPVNEYPTLRARLASTIELIRTVITAMTRLNLDLTTESSNLAIGERLSAVFSAKEFGAVDRLYFESTLLTAGSLWAGLRERVDYFLRTPYLVERCEGRIEAIAAQVGDVEARKLRIEIRAYIAQVKSKARFADLYAAMVAFDERIVPLERKAIVEAATAVEVAAPPASVKRGRSAEGREADRQLRISMKGTAGAKPLRGGGKKGKKAAA